MTNFNLLTDRCIIFGLFLHLPPRSTFGLDGSLTLRVITIADTNPFITTITSRRLYFEHVKNAHRQIQYTSLCDILLTVNNKLKNDAMLTSNSPQIQNPTNSKSDRNDTNTPTYTHVLRGMRVARLPARNIMENTLENSRRTNIRSTA